MKIEIEIPDWPGCDRRVTRIMKGIEQIAYKYPDQPWMIKSGRCGQCGKCCQSLSDHHMFPVESGQCSFLVPEPGTDLWRCGLLVHRPYGCCVTEPENEECTSKYKEWVPIIQS